LDSPFTPRLYVIEPTLEAIITSMGLNLSIGCRNKAQCGSPRSGGTPHLHRGSIMIGKTAHISVLALAVTASSVGPAAARTLYDGRWSLTIMTERGPCDPTYNFPVEVNNGIVTFPGLVRAGGRVSSKGRVRVSVAVGDRYASGAGRVNRTAGGGRWFGRSGDDRCSGSWRAYRY
jgi:hypothetical protein